MTQRMMSQLRIFNLTRRKTEPLSLNPRRGRVLLKARNTRPSRSRAKGQAKAKSRQQKPRTRANKKGTPQPKAKVTPQKKSDDSGASQKANSSSSSSSSSNANSTKGTGKEDEKVKTDKVDTKKDTKKEEKPSTQPRLTRLLHNGSLKEPKGPLGNTEASYITSITATGLPSVSPSASPEL